MGSDQHQCLRMEMPHRPWAEAKTQFVMFDDRLVKK